MYHPASRVMSRAIAREVGHSRGRTTMSLRLASRTAGLLATFTAMFVIAGPRPAAAQCGVGSPPQLCAAGAGDCAITSADCTITLPAGGLVINLGARRLVLTKNLKVNGPPGPSLTLNAGAGPMTRASLVAPAAAGPPRLPT